MEHNGKPNKKTAVLWALGFTSLLLVGCSNDVDSPNVSPAATNTSMAGQVKQEVVMFKSPNCECCTGWGDTLKTTGFTVIEKKHDDMDVIKAKYGVPERLASCHTAIIGGYVIEGHVPAADVQRLLKEKPQDVVGLTAPGMPQQSPGMQPEMLKPKNYDVLAFDKDGHTTVFSRY